MDIAGLSKLSADTITLIVGILAFLVRLSYILIMPLLKYVYPPRNSDLL
jgi:hypothetical protein